MNQETSSESEDGNLEDLDGEGLSKKLENLN